jgi:hypothetical protein
LAFASLTIHLGHFGRKEILSTRWRTALGEDENYVYAIAL